MGLLLGRAVAVVVCSVQSAMAACSCGAKMSSASNGTEAVTETMSPSANKGLLKAMTLPDIHVEHVSKSCDGTTTLLNGDEMSLSSHLVDLPHEAAICAKINHLDFKVDANTTYDNPIELPERFKNNVSTKINVDKYVQNKMDGGSYSDLTWSSSRNISTDMSRAILWIHHELDGMKEQDKILLRQFLDLRAAIRSLRAEGGRLRTLSYGGREEKTETLRQQSNGSDANDDVTVDDDDVFTTDGAPCNNSSLHPQCRIEFRGRTVSCISPRVKYNTPIAPFTKS